MSWTFLVVRESSDEPYPLLCLKPLDCKQGPLRIVTQSPMPELCSCPECSEARSTAQASTMMSRSSNCGEALTSLSEASHARTSAQQAVEKAWAESEAVFSSRSSASPATLDPSSSLWKTSQLLLLEEGSELLPSLPRWGTTRDGQLWELTIGGEAIAGIGGGALQSVEPSARPTVVASDYRGSDPGGQMSSLRRDVKTQAWAWPTPTASDTHTSNLKSSQQKEGSMHSVTLPQIAERLSSPRATPQQRDYRAPDLPGSGNHDRKLREGYTIDLNSQAAAWPWATPQSRDWKNGVQPGHQGTPPLNVQAVNVSARPTPRAGSTTGASKHGEGGPDLQTVASQVHPRAPKTGKRGPRSSQPSPKLNPLFCEWLMGMPFGTTALEPLATAWISSQRKQRSKSSLGASHEKRKDT